jgi:hypothetical protein
MSTLSLGAGSQQTPGVYTRESDQTLTVASGSSSQSAIAGVFAWGPVNAPVLLSEEDDLSTVFGKPSNSNFETWFVARDFLSHADSLWVNRVVDNTAFSAVANSSAVVSLPNHTIYNQDDFDVKSTSFEAGVSFIAKYPGAVGNSLRVAVCGSAAQYGSTVALGAVGANTLFTNANTSARFAVGSNVATITLANTAALASNTPLPYANTVAAAFTVGDILTLGNTAIGTQQVKITSVGAPVVANTAGANTGRATIAIGLSDVVKVADDFVTSSVTRNWEFASITGAAPSITYSTARSGNTAAVDGMHVVIVDEDGFYSGRTNAVLETYANLSRATDAKRIDGEPNFYKKVLNNKSAYVWAASDIAGLATNVGLSVVNATTTAPTSVSFVAGADGGDESTVSIGTIAGGYSRFTNKDQYNISSVIVGKTRGGSYGEQIFNNIIDNVGEKLQNIVVYGSPSRDVSVNNLDPLQARRNFRSVLRKSSYAVCDSGYKYTYDQYNDLYRFVPLCGDIAGASARTDVTNDPWKSPAGFTRGQINNIVKLAWNPDTAAQGVLFNELDINPVVTVLGEGTYLMGDKTLLGENSAFNSIGVRKLFNVLKTAIAKASRTLMFEDNDEFTQSRFRNLTEPYLRDVLGRRGIQGFTVVCDDTNNTDQVKANYNFVGDIFIKPTRSARTVTLNFIGVNSVAQFDES